MSQHPAKPPGPWDDFVIRVIGVYKFVKASVSVIAAIFLFSVSHKNIPNMVLDGVEFLHLSPEGHIVQAFVEPVREKAKELTPFRIRIGAMVVLLYACIFATEGYGLFFRLTWGEYLVTISTSIPLPFELYALYSGFGILKLALMIGNLAILIFLIHRLVTERLYKIEVRKEAGVQS
jgi:uncharacterized membrane protein (DUF2068 family)